MSDNFIYLISRAQGSAFQVARGLLDWEDLLQGEPDKDKDNLTAAAREDVGRVYHVMAAKNTSAILKKIEREGGGSRPTASGRSPIQERTEPGTDHVTVSRAQWPVIAVANAWRNAATRVPRLPLNTCRPYLLTDNGVQRLRNLLARMPDGADAARKPAFLSETRSTYPCVR